MLSSVFSVSLEMSERASPGFHGSLFGFLLVDMAVVEREVEHGGEELIERKVLQRVFRWKFFVEGTESGGRTW